MIPLARSRPRLAVVQALAILALLLSTLVLPSWWRWLAVALSVALAAGLLRVALSHPRLELDRTTLKIRTPTRTTSVNRRDVLLAVPLHAARPGAPNLRLRFRNDTTRVDLNALNPDAAVRELLEWIGKGPAKWDARQLLLTRLADALHTKIEAATSRSARRATRTRAVNARRQAPAPQTGSGPASGTSPQAANPPVSSACQARPADPAEARRLALTRVAIALHAATRSTHTFTVDDKGGS